MSDYKDWLGQPIEKGSIVIYAISESHYAKLVAGEVIDVMPVNKISYGRHFKLKVKPLLENTDFNDGEIRVGSNRNAKFERLADGTYGYTRIEPKPVTIQNVEKVTVCNDLPALRALLERYENEIDHAILRRNIELQQKRLEQK